VKEFLPDAPAPVQNKKTSSSLIQRFWQRLIGQSKIAEITEKPARTEERPHNPPRNQRKERPAGRNNPRRNNNKRNQNTPQTENAGNNVVNEELKQPVESIETSAETPAKGSTGAPQEPRSPRRGRNRRRSPRNGGERRPESGNVVGEAGDNQNQTRERPAPSFVENDAPQQQQQARHYASEFAERNQRIETPVQDAPRHESHDHGESKPEHNHSSED
jgi:ribonuclease E